MHPHSIRNDVTAGMLNVEWEDGTLQRLPHSELRNRCRCADCRAKHMMQQEISSDEVRLVELRPVGAYGVQFIFADGHERGIFPWGYLRSLA